MMAYEAYPLHKPSFLVPTFRDAEVYENLVERRVSEGDRENRVRGIILCNFNCGKRRMFLK
ncbi:hypothetical protein ABE28_009445 [Peribacillus muralis]|uniref:Uncharacterized protein n=1 Tax=Peribacillus muralis TaxID=264697 RepID=A0A1B3XMX8_9BACI|nr:hypothetical protein ABE28_009445 [Peribacillus muralis]